MRIKYKIPKENWEEIYKQWKRRVTLREIAIKWNVSISCVHSVIKKMRNDEEV